MKFFDKKPVFILAFVMLIQGCSSSINSDKNEETAPELVLLDSYSFRRAYHGQENLEGTEWDVFMNRNPEGIIEHANSKEHPLYKDLIRTKIVEEGDLNLSQIDTLPEQFQYHVSQTRKLQVEYELLEDPNIVDVPSYVLSFKEKQQTLLVDTLGFDFPPDVTFLTRDLNQDGKEELITIFRWYIVNGDNYDVSIYELREQ